MTAPGPRRRTLREPSVAQTASGGPSSVKRRGSTLAVLLCVSVPSFMINLDSNIVAVSLPAMAKSLHADFADMEWVISAYTLTFASLVLSAGSLADLYGRKRMLLLGLFLFTVASFVCGAADSVMTLIVARAIQGVGAALQLSAALAALSHAFRGPERARAFAFWGSVIGIAISLGPVAGGFITQLFGWQWAFYVNIPVGVGVGILSVRSLSESRDPNARRLDIAGVGTFSICLLCAVLALISGNRLGWTSRPVLLEITAAVVLFSLFLLVELRQQRPMLDLAFFRRRTYLGANIAGLAFAASLLTMLTYLPIFFQRGLGYSPEQAGLLMVPMAVPLFIVPRIVATVLSQRLTGRTLLAIGLGMVAVGLLWSGLATPSFSYVAMLGGMVTAGAGAGILNGEVAKVSMTVIPPERAGMASGMGGTVRFSGILLGFAALGVVLYERVAAVAAQAPAGFVQHVAAGELAGLDPALRDLALRSFGAGYQALILSAAAFAAVAAVASWLLISPEETAPTSSTSKADVAPID